MYAYLRPTPNEGTDEAKMGIAHGFQIPHPWPNAVVGPGRPTVPPAFLVNANPTQMPHLCPHLGGGGGGGGGEDHR